MPSRDALISAEGEKIVAVYDHGLTWIVEIHFLRVIVELPFFSNDDDKFTCNECKYIFKYRFLSGHAIFDLSGTEWNQSDMQKPARV